MTSKVKTTIPHDAAAVVLGKDGIEVLLPKGQSDDKPLPDHAVIAVAVGFRLICDEAFKDDVVDWMEKYAAKALPDESKTRKKPVRKNPARKK